MSSQKIISFLVWLLLSMAVKSQSSVDDLELLHTDSLLNKDFQEFVQYDKTIEFDTIADKFVSEESLIFTHTIQGYLGVDSVSTKIDDPMYFIDSLNVGLTNIYSIRFWCSSKKQLKKQFKYLKKQINISIKNKKYKSMKAGIKDTYHQYFKYYTTVQNYATLDLYFNDLNVQLTTGHYKYCTYFIDLQIYVPHNFKYGR